MSRLRYLTVRSPSPCVHNLQRISTIGAAALQCHVPCGQVRLVVCCCSFWGNLLCCFVYVSLQQSVSCGCSWAQVGSSTWKS